jgi:molybdate transport system ATP-binding protein
VNERRENAVTEPGERGPQGSIGTDRGESRSAPVLDAGLRVDIRQLTPVPLDIAFDCPPGRTVALFGASGSGKTSTLRAVAGLTRPRSGRISVGGEVWLDAERGIELPPHRRSVGYVFQDYALFPHLTVLGNVAAALRHLPKAARTARAREALAKVHLTGFEERRPSQLSGGQRQRVAVARALAREPRVLLLDEPFSAVDAEVRRSLYRELVELRRALAIPIVLVTHDFREVLRFADTVAVLDGGRIVASGTVGEISSRLDLPLLAAQVEPAVAFDAVIGAKHTERGLVEIELGDQRLLAPAVDLAVGSLIRVRIPAREVVLASQAPSGISIHNCLEARVASIADGPDGATVTVAVEIGRETLLAQVTRDTVARLSLAPGAAVYALIKSVAIDTIERAVATREA